MDRDRRSPTPTSGHGSRGTGDLEPTTGVAVDDGGRAVRHLRPTQAVRAAGLVDRRRGLRAGRDGRHPAGGSYPSVAVSPDGANVFLAWYGTVSQDLRLGVWGDVEDLQVAAPSPTPRCRPSAPSTARRECGDDGEIAARHRGAAGHRLRHRLPRGASRRGVHDQLRQPGSRRPAQHRRVHRTGRRARSPRPNLRPGPSRNRSTSSPLDEGTYFFQCDVHPTTMFGTLAVVKGAQVGLASFPDAVGERTLGWTG